MPKGESELGLFQQLGHNSSVLQGWMGSVAGSAGKPTASMGPAGPAGAFSSTAKTRDDPASLASSCLSITGYVMNLYRGFSESAGELCAAQYLYDRCLNAA